MAATVATITGVKREFTGSYIETVRTVTFDSTYPTGGEAITAAQFGLSTIQKVVGVTFVSGFASGFAHIDPLIQTDGSLLVRLRAAAGTEVANDADAHTVVCRITVKGSGA